MKGGQYPQKNGGRLAWCGVGGVVVVGCGCVGCGQKAKKTQRKKRGYKAPPHRKNDRLPLADAQRILYYYPELMYI